MIPAHARISLAPDRLARARLAVVRLTRVVLAVVVLAVLFGACDARAEDASMTKPSKPAARERLAAGNKLYRIREFEKAAEEYKAGALIEDAPLFYYNLGQCFRQLGRQEDAIWHYDRFLERGKPTGQVRTAVEEFLAQLRQELQRKAAPPPAEAPPPTNQPDPPPPPAPPAFVRVRVPGEPWHRDRIALALTGGGVLATGIGAALLISAKGIEDNANTEPAQVERQRLRDRSAGRRVTGVVVGGVGVAVLLVGLVKLAITPDDHEEIRSAAVRVGVTADTVFVAGSF